MKVSGQWSAVSGQRSVVSGQWSAVSGQQSAVSGQRPVVSGQWSEAPQLSDKKYADTVKNTVLLNPHIQSKVKG